MKRIMGKTLDFVALHTETLRKKTAVGAAQGVTDYLIRQYYSYAYSLYVSQ